EDLTFEELRQLIGDDQPSPAGLILHTGRCGSTLLTRMLTHHRSTLVVSEALSLSLLHRDALEHSDRRAANEQALVHLMVVFDRFARHRDQRPVFKLTSWQAADADRLLERL